MITRPREGLRSYNHPVSLLIITRHGGIADHTWLVVVGITLEGYKVVLGLWIGEHMAIRC